MIYPQNINVQDNGKMCLLSIDLVNGRESAPRTGSCLSASVVTLTYIGLIENHRTIVRLY